MSTEVTFQQVNELAHGIVVEYGPDHVYQKVYGGSCVYVDRYTNSALPCPSCFVGILLYALGVSLDTLTSADDNGYGPAACLFTHSELLPFSFDDRAMSFLARFQELQDDGKAWGQCMSQALTTAGSNPYYYLDHHASQCDYKLVNIDPREDFKP